MKKHFLLGFFYVGAVSMLAMSLHFFQHEISGILKYKDISSSTAFRFCFKAHILFGIIAIFVGPSQFITSLKAKFPALHRSMGYLYFLSVVISSTMGLLIAQYAMGGIISTIGFSILAIFWLSSVLYAFSAIVRGAVLVHKKWMFVSYGLTFAAIPQRTLLLVPLLFDIKFVYIYRLSAWLPWMLSTGLAFYLFKKSQVALAR